MWVINNGISHQESVPSLNGSILLQDMLDSIQFITGPAESQWGSLRASMGHPEPWTLTYMGIGNEVTHPACIPCISLQTVIDKGFSPIQWQQAAIGVPDSIHFITGLAESQWNSCAQGRALRILADTYIGISDEVMHLLTSFNIFIPFGIDGPSLLRETSVQSEQGHEHVIGQGRKLSVAACIRKTRDRLILQQHSIACPAHASTHNHHQPMPLGASTS